MYKFKCLVALMATAVVGSPVYAAPAVIAGETFASGANDWQDGASAAPIEHATGGHDNGAYISYVGNIATNTAAFGSALIEFRCQSDECLASGDLDFDWIHGGVINISYWFRHSAAVSIEAYLRVAPISGVGGGAGSALTGFMMTPNVWHHVSVDIAIENWDQAFGGGNYNNIFTQVGKIQPGIFFPFGTVYNETGVTFDLDDVEITAIPVVSMDIDPYTEANDLRPASDNPIVVAVHSTTAIPDGLDFDATQIDEATLSFGQLGAPNIALPWVVDADNDGNTNDVLYVFKMQAAGVMCSDTELSLTGETYAGDAFISFDAVQTSDCVDTFCHEPVPE